MKMKNGLSIVLIVVWITMITLPTVAGAVGNTQAESGLQQTPAFDNTPEYFDNSFSDMQGLELDAFLDGFDPQLYRFLSEYIACAAICVCNPSITESEIDDAWVFYEFVLEGISLEEAKALFELNYGKAMPRDEESYCYAYEGHAFGLCYEDDDEGDTIVKYSIRIRSDLLPDSNRIVEEYSNRIDIPFPSSDTAYLNSFGVVYDTSTKEIIPTYEFTFFSGECEAVFDQYINTLSQTDGYINPHGDFSSVIKPGVMITAYIDKDRYDGVDALSIEVTPLPISVFTCGFEEQLNRVFAEQPIPGLVADLLAIVMPSFPEYEMEMKYSGNNMSFVIHSDTYNGRQFYQEVFDYLQPDGEADSSPNGFWYIANPYIVSFHYNQAAHYTRFEIQGNDESLLNYGETVYTVYPYHLVPKYPDDMDVVDISYPIFIQYNVDNETFSYHDKGTFTVSADISGCLTQDEAVERLARVYPPRNPYVDLTVKGVPAYVFAEYHNEWDANITSVEISFDQGDILRRNDDDDE